MIYRPTIMNAIEDSEKVVDEASQNWSSYFGTYSPFYHVATENVAYHYLYEEMEKEPNVQKVKTRLAGFGMSNSPTDLAFIHKK